MQDQQALILESVVGLHHADARHAEFFVNFADRRQAFPGGEDAIVDLLNDVPLDLRVERSGAWRSMCR